MQKRALAATRRTHDGEEARARDFKIDAAQRGDRSSGRA